MQVKAAWKKIGRHHEEIPMGRARAILKDLKVNHYSERQRKETDRLKRAKYLHGELWGPQLEFVATYIVDTGTLEFADGNTRVEGILVGITSLPKTGSIGLTVYTVQTEAQAQAIYDQINSLEAAKRSHDYFESGLNQAELRGQITSPLILTGGRATAVQLAYGKKGSRNTQKAVVELKEGLTLLDSWQLHHHGEIAGVIGAYLAIAQYCKDKALAEEFVRNINANSFSFAKTKGTNKEMAISKFRKYVRNRKAMTAGTLTGGGVNNDMFETALSAFYEFYCVATKKKQMVSKVTLGSFKLMMS
jgi:hypothetical protein